MSFGKWKGEKKKLEYLKGNNKKESRTAGLNLE